MSVLDQPLALLPFAMLLPLAATIRQTLPASAAWRAPLIRVLTSPHWLVPLIVIVPMTVGLMMTGQLSPLPDRSFAQVATAHGEAIGWVAVLAVVMAELWLLVTPAQILIRSAEPAAASKLRAAIPLNLLLGGSFLGLVLLLVR